MELFITEKEVNLISVGRMAYISAASLVALIQAVAECSAHSDR
jgi:hypothetical protein